MLLADTGFQLPKIRIGDGEVLVQKTISAARQNNIGTIVVGGGVSKKHDKFLPLLDLKTEIVPAKLFNTAGIVGAAALAAKFCKDC